MRTATARLLHVANGSSTTSTIAAAGIPGARSIWCDPLYEGPVPDVADDEMIGVRGRYLSGDDAGVDPVNDLNVWRRTIADHDSYDELVLWYEHDLFDQLNLIQLLSWIRKRLPSDKTVSLICVNAFPGRPRFMGLGELTPGELASLADTRRAVTRDEYDLAERAWRAFRQSSPEAIDELRRGDMRALPYLAAALGRFLQEYPWTTDGLSRSERRLLQIAERGPIAVRTAFPRMRDGEDTYHITDLSLTGLVESLSRTSPPLAAADGARRDDLSGTVAATAAGRDVLAGRLDRVACGIDRWLGGVHLNREPGTGTREPVWRWDDGRNRIVKR